MTVYRKIDPKPKLVSLSDRQLAAYVTRYAPKIMPLGRVARRDLNIRNLAVRARVEVGSSKRCHEHHPCWNLGCLMCRYRAQLNCVKNLRSVLKGKKKSQAKGGEE